MVPSYKALLASEQAKQLQFGNFCVLQCLSMLLESAVRLPLLYAWLQCQTPAFWLREAPSTNRFGVALDAGRKPLADILENASKEGGQVNGADAFLLYDTYGFPLEITLDAAADQGLQVLSCLPNADGHTLYCLC